MNSRLPFLRRLPIFLLLLGLGVSTSAVAAPSAEHGAAKKGGVTQKMQSAPAERAGSSFEGRIRMKVTSGRETTEMEYAMKGAKMRIDAGPADERMASIIDLQTKQMLMLIDSEKMYMVMKMPEAPQGKAEKEEGTIEKTSETAVIAGYTATKYLVRSKDAKEPIEVWATEDLGTFFNPDSFGGPFGGKSKPPVWESLLRNKGFFPLRTIVREKRTETRMEVVAVDKASLPDSLFTPPADYKRMDMPGMGGLLPGLLKP
jgi:hypothetical protein